VKRTCLVVAALCAGSIVSAGAPALADYPGPSPAPPSVSASTVVSGQSVTFTAGGFAPGSTVTVTDNGVIVGAAGADAHGVFVLSVTIGSVGTHTLTAAGRDASGAPLSVTATVEGTASGGSSDGSLITGPAGSGTSSGTTSTGRASGLKPTTLPRTGSDLVVPGAISGVALVLMGGTGVVVARRRRTDSLS